MATFFRKALFLWFKFDLSFLNGMDKADLFLLAFLCHQVKRMTIGFCLREILALGIVLQIDFATRFFCFVEDTKR